MRVHGTRAYIEPTPVPKMPAGLVELMEGLSREVLKNNPTEVYKFCAQHMRNLLVLRDGKRKFNLFYHYVCFNIIFSYLLTVVIRI